MKRLSYLEEDEVGDVDDVVDGIVTDGDEFLLEPFRRRADLDALDGDPGITGSALGVEHLHGYALSCPLAESGDVGHVELARNTVEPQPRIEVAGDADVRRCIHAVGCDLILDHGFGLEVQVVLGGSADDGIGLEHHDAGMVFADAELVSRADHAERLNAADLGFLDLEIAGKDGAEGGEKDLLAGGDIGSTADHGDRLAVTGVHLRDVQVIGVRMRFAFEHFGHHYAGETSGDLFLFFDRIHLDAYRGDGIRHLGGSEIELKIVLEPIVRQLHIVSVFISSNLPG